MATGPRPDATGAMFTWRGDGPPPVVVGSWCGWNPARGLPMRRSGGAWEAHLDLPQDAYVEYALFRDDERIADPSNLHRVSNGLGSWNYQLWMPDAPRRAIELSRRRVPRGVVVRGTLDLGFLAASPQRRRFDLYRPPGSPRADLPLLVVLDGADYLVRGRLPRLLDALIADGSMGPIAAAFIANAGPARPVEYVASDATAAVLADVVVPAARERLGLQGSSSGRAAILGSSMGGLMALHAGLRRPDAFATVIAQSTWLGQGLPGDPELTLLQWIRHAPRAPTRIWLDVGLETLAEGSDKLAALLRARGYDVTDRRLAGGHDQTSWTEGLVRALPEVYPGA